jgi:putative transposase
MDFMADTLAGGKRYRVLTLVDFDSRECLKLKTGFSLRASDVVDTLTRLRVHGSTPEVITVDNGSEFSSKHMDTWAHLNGVKLDFIRPGKPVEDAFIESFNGRVRDECLDANLFYSLADVHEELARWQEDYNGVRPHGSLGGGYPPREFCATLQTEVLKPKNSTFECA